MRTYEMTLILRAAEEDFTKGKQLVSELLSKHGVTVEKEQDMGNRILAYPINKEEKGHYLYSEINSDPAVIVKLERALRLMQPVLKFLIVRKDEDAAAEPQAAPKAETPVQEKAPAPAEAEAEAPKAAPVEAEKPVEEKVPVEEKPAEAEVTAEETAAEKVQEEPAAEETTEEKKPEEQA